MRDVLEALALYAVFLGVPYLCISLWVIWAFTGANPFDPRNWR